MKHHNRRGVLPTPQSGFVDLLSREFTPCMALDGFCHGECHRLGKLLGTPVATGDTAGAGTDAKTDADQDAMFVVMLRFGGGSWNRR